MKQCSESDCDLRPLSRGLCNKHYLKLRFSERLAQPIPLGEKTCKVCGQSKSFADFAVHGGCRDGFRPDCKQCTAKYQKTQRKNYRGPISRRYTLKKNFGITEQQYADMLASQNGKCAICGLKKSSTKISNFLSVDHDHETGAIRGLLCAPCNTGIGMLKDNPSLLQKGIDYLLKGRN